MRIIEGTAGLLAVATLFVSLGCGGGADKASVAASPTGSESGTTPMTVSILSPQPASTVTGTFRVQATASGSTALRVVLDGTQMWAGSGTVADTSLTATEGPHHLTVSAVDGTRTVDASVDFQVASAAVTPTYTYVANRLEERTDWQTCGNCGNTGGSGSSAIYAMQPGVAQPSTDGNSAEFSIGGTYPYTNGYWWVRHSAPTTRINELRYEFDLYIPNEFATASQAIEFECQQQVDGYIYNFAWQANFAGKSWRVFDYVNRQWDATGIALTQLTSGQWHHVVAEYHTQDATVFHDALTIDGTRYAVGMSHAAKYVGGTSRQFTNAFQLDLNKVPTPYDVYVDGMTVSYR